MTNILSRALPPPSNWQDFERLCFDVFSRIWKTNDAEMHGRTGQPQAGVDVYGTDRVEGQFVGVQCKGKDQSYGNPLTAAELREEVTKAKSFDPPLDLFVLATTAPNDATMQKLGRELTQKHKRSRLFEVRVVGWTSLRQRVTDYPDLVRKYFPDFAPIDIVEAIEFWGRGEQNRRRADEGFSGGAVYCAQSPRGTRRAGRQPADTHYGLRSAYRNGVHKGGAQSLGAPLVQRIRQRHATQLLSDAGEYRIRATYAGRSTGRRSGIACRCR